MTTLSEHLDTTFRDCVRSEADLFPEQREAIEFAWSKPFSALFMDVGTGKTCVSLTIMDRLWMRGYRGKFLIVAPIRVATRVWPYEPRLWTHLAYMKMTVIRIDDDDPRLARAYDYGYQIGKSKGYDSAMCSMVATRMQTRRKDELRTDLLDSPNQIHVVNQEAVAWLVDKCLEERNSWPYKVVVFDESSRLRDHNSVVFKALNKVKPYIKRFHQLTATPASQTYMHLFSQIYLLDGGERFGRGITAFRERYFTYNPYERTWTLREGAAEEIERKIADICLVQRRERDFQINVRSIRLSQEQMDKYYEFERDLVLQLEDKVIDGVNGAVLASKLIQYASGAVYDEKRQFSLIHDEKIEELKSLIDETLDEPVLIAYWFKSTLARLKDAFPSAVVMDREGKMEGSWNARRHKLMLVHPMSVGHGLNLQKGGHHLVVFDLFYSAELMSQLIGRLDRQGQTRMVMVHILSVQGSMDEIVSAKLRFLENAETTMFNRLRELRLAARL